MPYGLLAFHHISGPKPWLPFAFLCAPELGTRFTACLLVMPGVHPGLCSPTSNIRSHLAPCAFTSKQHSITSHPLCLASSSTALSPHHPWTSPPLPGLPPTLLPATACCCSSSARGCTAQRSMAAAGGAAVREASVAAMGVGEATAMTEAMAEGMTGAITEGRMS